MEKRGHFLYRLFYLKEIFLTFLFYLSVKCTEHTFRIYILLHIKKRYFIRFCCLFLKLPNVFSVFLNHEPFLLMIVYEIASLCYSKAYFISVS